MKEYYWNNINLLEQKGFGISSLFIYLILWSVIALIIMLFVIETHDIYTYNAIVTEIDNITYCNIIIEITDYQSIINYDYIKINNAKNEVSIFNVSEVKLDSYGNYYQEISFNCDNQLVNTYLEIKIYVDKEKLINKIKNAIEGGENA